MLGQMVVYSYLPQNAAALFTSYLPSLVEIGAGLGVVAYGMLAFTIGVRYFRIIDHYEEAHEEHVVEPAAVPAMSGD
jgi:Ni/Fe-hydrogenase subunit HybB-like protein